MDDDRWITYTQTDQPYEVFEEWLNKNLPSCYRRSDGIGWISVKGNKVTNSEEIGDLETLEIMWEEIQKSNRPINVNTISDLARICKVTDGKWLFHVDAGGKADHLWSIVAKGIIKDLIPCHSAKVSPVDDSGKDSDGYQHVVCIYNNNFLNQEEVFDCEHGLRKIGIKCPLMYKPDVYTYLGVYRNNPWDMRPTIYRSEYDIITGQSKIDVSSAPC